MKRLLSFCLFITVVFIAKAEVGVEVGAKAGFNIAHLRKFSAPENYKKRVTVGSDIGAVLRINVHKNFAVQTGIEFTQKGQAWKRTIDSAKIVNKQVLNYIQFPVLAVGKVGSEKVKGVFMLGPYFAYWAGGYTQEAVSVEKMTRNESHEKYLFSKNDRRFDVGLVTGAGVNVKVGKGWIEVMARHQLGFMSIASKKSVAPNLFNCNFNLSVGYLYTIK